MARKALDIKSREKSMAKEKRRLTSAVQGNKQKKSNGEAGASKLSSRTSGGNGKVPKKKKQAVYSNTNVENCHCHTNVVESLMENTVIHSDSLDHSVTSSLLQCMDLSSCLDRVLNPLATESAAHYLKAVTLNQLKSLYWCALDTPPMQCKSLVSSTSEATPQGEDQEDDDEWNEALRQNIQELKRLLLNTTRRTELERQKISSLRKIIGGILGLQDTITHGK